LGANDGQTSTPAASARPIAAEEDPRAKSVLDFGLVLFGRDDFEREAEAVFPAVSERLAGGPEGVRVRLFEGYWIWASLGIFNIIKDEHIDRRTTSALSCAGAEEGTFCLSKFTYVRKTIGIKRAPPEAKCAADAGGSNGHLLIQLARDGAAAEDGRECAKLDRDRFSARATDEATQARGGFRREGGAHGCAVKQGLAGEARSFAGLPTGATNGYGAKAGQKEARVNNKVKVWVVAAALTACGFLGAQGALADEGADVAALRERVAKLEGEVAWHQKAVYAVAGLVVTAMGAFFVSVRDGVKKRGLKELVDKAVGELLKDDDARLTRMFGELKAELLKKILARDRVIGLIGLQDKEQVKASLERMGFYTFVNDIEKADVVVVLGIERCRREAEGIARRGVPAVLYTGTERLKPEEEVLERLNEVSLAIPASTPVTAAQHAANLLMLTGKPLGRL